ncbi:MAG: D-alanyl-D-alanine carboxypeptidase/D-alanyl-D-alanine-endopeptidase [Verrucomicrobiota bacterium]
MNLPRLLRAAALAGFLGLALPATAAEPALAALQAALSNHLAQPRFAAAAWGVKVATLDSGRTLFAHQADKLLKPASNAKLYTGALALDRLGPDFRIRTSLYATRRPDRSGTLRGDLLVYGRGDPSFSERFPGVNITNVLAPVVDALAAAGVQRITGSLIGDESFFRGPPLGSEWTWGDLQRYYGAEASALTVQDNVVDLILRPGPRPGAPCLVQTLPPTAHLTFDNRTRTVGSNAPTDVQLYRPLGQNLVYLSGSIAAGTNVTEAVAVTRPALWFVTLLREALQRRGIKVGGGVRAVDWLERQAHPLDLNQLVEIAAVESRPLSEILPRMMKPSQNLYAHLLLLQVGARAAAAGEEKATTEDHGLADLRRFLDGAGIARGETLLEEGSGLSRAALVTPNATVALLRFMHRHPHGAVFRESLPAAGREGTLRNRMKETPAFDNARAKTGTLRHVNTLSGQVTTRAGQPLVFSLMLNNYDGQDGRPALDAIVVLLAEQAERFAE